MVTAGLPGYAVSHMEELSGNPLLRYAPIGVLLLVAFCWVVVDGIRGYTGRLTKDSDHTVKLEGQEIVHIHPDGTREQVVLSDLGQVLVQTNGDYGPFENLFIVLRTVPGAASGRGCAFPMGANGSDVVTIWLQRQPGFDYAAWTEATESPTGKTYEVWRRPA